MFRALGRLILAGVTCVACGSSEPDDSVSAGGKNQGGAAGLGHGDAGGGNVSANAGRGGKAQGGSTASGGEAGAGASAGTTPSGGSGNVGGAEEVGGANDGGTAEAGGSGGEGPAPLACPGCDGPCLEDGTCVECTEDSHCGQARCDTDAHACVECLAQADNCPDDQYCSDAKVCIPGCKDDASCGSGICTDDHDCEHCLNDDECAEGRLCSTGVCMVACDDEGAECDEDRLCCGGRCVDTARDSANCGACASTDETRACGGDAICGRDGCVSVRIASVCANARIAVIRGNAPLDFPSGDRLAAALAGCTLPPEARTVSQSEPVVSNVSTGQPFAGVGDLLVVAGGPYVQSVTAYLEVNEIASVRHVYVQEQGTYEFHRVSDGAVLASVPVATVGETHDIVKLELVRDRESGAPILIVSGFNQSGTAAGAWYFENVVMPSLETYDDAYYVYEWNDAGDPGPDAADEFERRASGR